MPEILAESFSHLLVHEFEDVFVIDRATGARSAAGDHYGDPSIGIIAPDESWVATGGEGVIVWRSGRIDEYLRRDHIPADTELRPGEFFAVTELKLDGPSRLRIQVDPMSRLAAEWLLDIETGALRRLHDFAV
jgi:hypothetical protein